MRRVPGARKYNREVEFLFRAWGLGLGAWGKDSSKLEEANVSIPDAPVVLHAAH
jgi:hypothetical protein